MKKKIDYRVFKRQDKKELIRILTDQVYSSFFEKGKDAERYSRFILNKNLGTCKYRKVAVAGDKVVGVVLGIKKDENRLLSSLKQKISEMPLKIKKKNKEAWGTLRKDGALKPCISIYFLLLCCLQFLFQLKHLFKGKTGIHCNLFRR